MAKKKFDPRNLVLMFISIGFTLVILEVALRILFSTNQTFLMKNFQDRSYLFKHKYWKVWHYPNIEAKHIKDCFDVIYTANSLGMRDEEVNIEKDTSVYRIALLGDSFVEGYSKSDHQIFPNLLDSMLGKKVEVLNFGTSGGFGNIHQLALYENFVTHFKPDLVLLFFLNYNDMHDNFKAIEEGYITEDLEFQYPVDSLKNILAMLNNQEIPEPINPVLTQLYIFDLANKGGRAFNTFVQSAMNMKADFNRSLINNYLEEEPADIKKGYAVARKSFERLKLLVENDSSELVVLQLPDPFQIDDNWKSASELKFDLTLNPTHPNDRVKAMCEDMDILYHDMYPAAMAYIENNDLNFPYFSHTCDRHPSELGHQYLADEVKTYLLENHLNN